MTEECPSCKKQCLKANGEWDKIYEMTESDIPTHIFVVRELKRKGVPENICTECKYEKMTEV